MSLDGAWPRGDTIEAFDGDRSRIVRFLPGDSVESVSLERVPSGQVAVPGVLGDGWVLYGVESAEPGSRDQMRIHRFARSGTHVGSIGSLEGMLRFQAGNFRGPTPLSPKGLLALHGDRVFVAESLTPRVGVIDSTGASIREITWRPEPSMAPREALRLVIDSAADLSLEGQVESSRERLEAAPPPERLSVAWGLIVDAEGFLWLRPFDPLRNAAALGGLRGAGTGGTWMILAPAGTRIGAVQMPDGLEPIQITSDAVVGIHRDGYGVESVRVHTLTRSG